MSCITRLGYLSTRGITRQFVCSTQPRLYSVLATQRARPLRHEFGLTNASRSYWWSSSKTPAKPEVQEPASPEALPEQPTLFDEQVLTETPAVAEPTSAAESAAATVVDVSGIPADAVASVSDPSVATTAIQPLQYGDLAALGLAGWTPAGICRWGIELLQVSTGMPWFWTIIDATIVSRVILLPFTIKSMRATAAMAPYQDEILALRDKMQQAQRTKDTALLQTVVMKQRMIYEKAGVSMGGMAILPIIQLPVTLGMFFGVKKMCDLPLEQLKDSGVWFLPDLTAADPTGILPIASAVMMNVQLSLGLKDMTAAPHIAHMVNLFRVLSLISIPLTWNLPSGLMVYLVSSISLMSLQTFILRQPVVRKLLRIPVIPAKHENKSATFKESIDYARKWWQEKKTEQEAAIRASRRK